MSVVMKFLGGPLDGDERSFPFVPFDFFVPIPLPLRLVQPTDDLPLVSELLKHVYQRRGDTLYYVGEQR